MYHVYAITGVQLASHPYMISPTYQSTRRLYKCQTQTWKTGHSKTKQPQTFPIKMINKQLFALLQLLVISSVITAVPHKTELDELVKNHLLPDFVGGGLVEPYRQQFAAVLLLRNTHWMQFLYNPSVRGDGEKPVINPSITQSPPDDRRYNNYIAAAPYRGVHAEEQFLREMRNLFNAYRRAHRGRYPGALLLYSVIVPCRSCTDNIVHTLTRSPFNLIRTKVVAYTTNGSNCHNCDVNHTRRTLDRNGILLTKVNLTNEEFNNIFTIRSMDE